MSDFSKLSQNGELEINSLKMIFPKNSAPLKSLRILEGPGTSGGGGDVILCGKYIFKLFAANEKPEIFLADTIELFKSGRLNKSEILPEKIWMEAIFTSLNKIDHNSPAGNRLGDLVKKRLSELHFNIEDHELDELDDDGIDLKQIGCEQKKQLAIQNLETGEVRVNRDLIGRLSYAEVYFFKVHEALISLKKTVDDTSPIRKELQDAIQKVNLENIIEEVMQDYVEIPNSLRYLWAMKVLYKNEFLTSFSPYEENCPLESKTNYLKPECFPPLLSWRKSQDSHDSHAFLVVRNYYFDLVKVGFLAIAISSNHLFYELEKQTTTAGLVYTAMRYFNPTLSFQKKSDIQLDEIEATHISVIQALRKAQWQSVLVYPANIINILNEDYENFRKKYLGENYLPSTEKISEPSDKWFELVGSCYWTQNYAMYKRNQNSSDQLVGWLQMQFTNRDNPVDFKDKRIAMSKEFIQCLGTNGIIATKVNLNQNEDEFLIELSQHFEKNFYDFVSFVQNSVILDHVKQ